VLHFAGVGLSHGSSFDRLVGGLCKECRVMYTSWLLETPAKSLTVQNDYKWLSSAKEMVSLVPVDWGLRCAQWMGHQEG